MNDADDAPFDRTGEAVMKADLFDTAQWLDRRIGAVRDDLAGMQAGSGDITDRIMGDLAGIRSEQIHLSRQMDMLASELKLGIRKELRSAGEVERRTDRSPGAGRWAGALMGFLIVTFLATMLVLLGLALLPAPGLDDWLPEQWP